MVNNFINKFYSNLKKININIKAISTIINFILELVGLDINTKIVDIGEIPATFSAYKYTNGSLIKDGVFHFASVSNKKIPKIIGRNIVLKGIVKFKYSVEDNKTIYKKVLLRPTAMLTNNVITFEPIIVPTNNFLSVLYIKYDFNNSTISFNYSNCMYSDFSGY